jgi:hypothetical protein
MRLASRMEGIARDPVRSKLVSAASLAQYGAIAEQERDSLRRYIAANIVGDNPPPLTKEACELIRRVLGSDQVEEIPAA